MLFYSFGKLLYLVVDGRSSFPHQPFLHFLEETVSDPVYCVLPSFLNRYQVPDDPNVPYDMLEVVKKVVDEGVVTEIMPNYAKNIICGFARMEGRTVGVSSSMRACVCVCGCISSVCLLLPYLLSGEDRVEKV
jgi:hypothetical protein